MADVVGARADEQGRLGPLGGGQRPLGGDPCQLGLAHLRQRLGRDVVRLGQDPERGLAVVAAQFTRGCLGVRDGARQQLASSRVASSLVQLVGHDHRAAEPRQVWPAALLLAHVERSRDGAVAHQGAPKRVHGLEVRAAIRREGQRSAGQVHDLDLEHAGSSMMVEKRSTERTPRST